MNTIYSNTNRPVYAPVTVTASNFAFLSSEAQTTYHPLTKLELVTSAIQNKTFRHALDIMAGEYWDKAFTRAECINHLIEVALQFIPSHLNLSVLLRREVNQEFRIRIA